MVFPSLNDDLTRSKASSDCVLQTNLSDFLVLPKISNTDRVSCCEDAVSSCTTSKVGNRRSEEAQVTDQSTSFLSAMSDEADPQPEASPQTNPTSNHQHRPQRRSSFLMMAASCDQR